MALVLRVEGDEQALDAGLNAFTRHHGWTEESEVSQLEYARQVLVRLMREAVKCWNVEEAKKQSAIAIAAQTELALDQLNTTLETEP